MKISVMIPVWNEEKRLASCIDSLLEYGSKNLDGNMEIIVCADGCTDETVNIANSYARRYPNVKLAEWPDRLGKGGGILNGIKMVDGDVVVITDVDLSASPEEIQKLVSPINNGKADFVVGSRNLAGSTITKKPPIHRIFLGRAFNFLFRMLFHADFHDTQCGFKAIKTEILVKLRDDLTIEGYAFDIDLMVKALRHGYRVVEAPIVWGYKTGSKVDSLGQSYEMARSLLIVWLENLKREPELSSDERSVRKFYDSIPGDTYLRAVRSWFLPRSLWHKSKNKSIIDNVRLNGIVLDAGCGSGTLIESLLTTGKVVYGIDLGIGFVRFCHGRYRHSENASFIVADSRDAPFRSDAFDYIICSEVLEHVDDPYDALSEFHRTLATGGRLILTTPNISLRWGLVEAVWTHVRKRMIETKHRAFTELKVGYLLSRAGFQVLEQRKIIFGCILFFVAEKKPK